MIRKNFILTGLMFCCMFVFSGCRSETKIQARQVKPEINEQEIAAKEMERAQEMELAAIKAQDENVELKAKIAELTRQLKSAQDELDAYKEKMAEPESWEEKYNKLKADNDELRKLVQYERGLREDLLKRVEKDQATINELKNKLEE